MSQLARDPLNPTAPLRAMSRNKTLLAASLVTFGTLGMGLGFLMPTMHNAQMRLVVGSEDLRAVALPGYALGTRQQASNYARYINNATKKEAPGGIPATISASPIPESNVIIVESQAATSADAVKGAEAAAKTLQDAVASVRAANNTDAVWSEVEQLSKEEAEAHIARDAAAGEYERVKSLPGATPAAKEKARLDFANKETEHNMKKMRRDAAASRYRELVQRSANEVELEVVQAATATGSTSSSNIQKGALGGLLLGGVIGLSGALLRDRKKNPREDRSDTQRAQSQAAASRAKRRSSRQTEALPQSGPGASPARHTAPRPVAPTVQPNTPLREPVASASAQRHMQPAPTPVVASSPRVQDVNPDTLAPLHKQSADMAPLTPSPRPSVSGGQAAVHPATPNTTASGYAPAGSSRSSVPSTTPAPLPQTPGHNPASPFPAPGHTHSRAAARAQRSSAPAPTGSALPISEPTTPMPPPSSGAQLPPMNGNQTASPAYSPRRAAAAASNDAPLPASGAPTDFTRALNTPASVSPPPSRRNRR